jgi:hypothetical protein
VSTALANVLEIINDLLYNKIILTSFLRYAY